MVEYCIFVEDGYVLTKVNFTFWGCIKLIFSSGVPGDVCILSRTSHIE